MILSCSKNLICFQARKRKNRKKKISFNGGTFEQTQRLKIMSRPENETVICLKLTKKNAPSITAVYLKWKQAFKVKQKVV